MQEHVEPYAVLEQVVEDDDIIAIQDVPVQKHPFGQKVEVPHNMQKQVERHVEQITEDDDMAHLEEVPCDAHPIEETVGSLHVQKHVGPYTVLDIPSISEMKAAETPQDLFPDIVIECTQEHQMPPTRSPKPYQQIPYH